MKEHNPNGPDILDDPYKILIFGGSVPKKSSSYLN